MKKFTARALLVIAILRLAPFTAWPAFVALGLHVIGKGKPFSMVIRGRRIFFPSIAELYTAKQILLDHIYEVPTKSARRIVDLGANIGLASIFFALRYPEADIDSYEPDPVTFTYLVKNTRGLRVQCHQSAIAASNGSATFYRNSNSVASSLTPMDSAVEKVVVETVTPEDLGSIDLLKIDVEGAETMLHGHTFSARIAVGESTELEAIAELFKDKQLTWRDPSAGIFVAT